MQWKEAEEKESHLESEKRASALSDASRKWFLKQETSAAREHGGDLPCEGECPWVCYQGYIYRPFLFLSFKLCLTKRD